MLTLLIFFKLNFFGFVECLICGSDVHQEICFFCWILIIKENRDLAAVGDTICQRA